MLKYLYVYRHVLFNVVCSSLTLHVAATIAGISYMDPLIFRNHKNPPPLPGEDPCKPLYWYPRHIPDYCYNNDSSPPKPQVQPITVPIPVPVPQPYAPPMYPMPMPAPPPMPVPQPMPMPMPMPQPYGMPMIPAPQPYPGPVPLPYGIPLASANPFIPVPGYMPSFRAFGPLPMAGMVPGIEGLVSRDGGINVLPFSDVYSDILEKHKNKMMRRKLKEMMNGYNR